MQRGARRRGDPRGRLCGGIHPYYYTAVGFYLLWTAGILGMGIASAVINDESLITGDRIVIAALAIASAALGLAGLIGIRRACSVRTDVTGIRRGKHEDPAQIRWNTITSFTVGSEGSNFRLVDLPILDELFRGHSRRLLPRVSFEHPRYGPRTVALHELSRRMTRSGLNQVSQSIDVLRSRAGVAAYSPPSYDDLVGQVDVKEFSPDAPKGYQPRRARE